jgi:hypothetical protein
MNIRSLYRPGDTASCISRFVDSTSSLFITRGKPCEKKSVAGLSLESRIGRLCRLNPILPIQPERDVSLGFDM